MQKIVDESKTEYWEKFAVHERVHYYMITTYMKKKNCSIIQGQIKKWYCIIPPKKCESFVY